MISHQIFFGQYPDEKQLQRINAIWKKKSGRFKTVEQTMITLELSSDAFACRPFRSLSPLFISSNAKLRRFTYHNHGREIRGKSKKSVSWSRPRREVRFFGWCSACLKHHILSILSCCKILTIFAVFHGKFRSEIFSSFEKWIKIGSTW